ncbi:MAG: phosphotransferase [Anaerolineae bacterium]|nr:phosphotransferase [Anaerolineae bacterium]
MTALPPDNPAAYVLRLAFGRSVAATPAPVAPGESEHGLAFALDGPGVPPYVLLRRYPSAQQAQALRAFRVMRALGALRFPVPAVYYLGWSQHDDHTLLLAERVAGWRVAGQPHAFFARAGADFARTLARLHALPWDSLPDLPVTPLRYAFGELARLVRRLETWELQEILDWLIRRVDAVEELPRAITHGEYTLERAVAQPPRIVAIEGWEHAVLADPRFDIGFASAMLGAYGLALSDHFQEAYQAVAGAVPDLVFWEVFSALRLLARVGRSLSTLRAEQRERFLARAFPYWQGLLALVQARTRVGLL